MLMMLVVMVLGMRKLRGNGLESTPCRDSIHVKSGQVRSGQQKKVVKAKREDQKNQNKICKKKKKKKKREKQTDFFF